jgi:hypothetical protein
MQTLLGIGLLLIILQNQPEVDANGLTVINGHYWRRSKCSHSAFSAPTNGTNSKKQSMVGKLHGNMISPTQDLASLANYTIVDGSAEYDNTVNAAAGNQFALVGLSDSANLVGLL